MAAIDVLNILSVSAARLEFSSGGGSSLSSHDVAAMLSGASREAELLAYAKYVQDESALAKLRAHVFCVTKRKAITDNWNDQRLPSMLVKLSALAVGEVCTPMVCGKCSGRGFVGAKSCCRCDGSGHYRLSKRRMAEIVGVNESNWRRRWSERYEWIYRYLLAIESDIYRAIASQNRVENMIVC